MRSLSKLESSFSLVKSSIIFVLVSNLAVIAFCLAYSHMFENKQSQRIYALNGEIPVMIALGQNVKENRQAEAKAQLRNFHKLFFSIVPDMAEIEYNMREAMLMSDESISKLYSQLSDGGYYRQICEANIRCSYVCDSIVLNLAEYPYHATCYGKTSIVRTSGTTVRSLVTSCMLRNVLRTDEIPHGFLIENFTVVRNEDINVNSIYR